MFNIILKTMAQSFLANAGTRLHPSEYASGVAAGAAAVMLATSKRPLDTSDVYDVVDEQGNRPILQSLQHLLTSDPVKSPISW